MGRKRAEDRLLDLLALGGGLDHQVGGADGLELGRRSDAAHGRLHFLRGDDLAGHLPGHVAADQGEAGLDPVGTDVVQQDVVSTEGDHVGDARPHLPCANDADRPDFRHV